MILRKIYGFASFFAVILWLITIITPITTTKFNLVLVLPQLMLLSILGALTFAWLGLTLTVKLFAGFNFGTSMNVISTLVFLSLIISAKAFASTLGSEATVFKEMFFTESVTMFLLINFSADVGDWVSCKVNQLPSSTDKWAASTDFPS